MLRIVPALAAARATALGARRTVWQRSRAVPLNWATLYVLLNRQSLQYRESVRYVHTFFWVFILYSTAVKDKKLWIMIVLMWIVIVLMWKKQTSLDMTKIASETKCTIVVVGDSRTGKSALLHRFVHKSFQPVRHILLLSFKYVVLTIDIFFDNQLLRLDRFK